MKKTALTLLLTVAAISGNAQTIYDALRFSESYYEGTARTMAMGNAFTALGGDLGAVNINPAGSAVAGYSQITISPAINISVNNAGGTTLQGESSPFCFENRIKNPFTRFNVPNFGISMNYDTHRSSGIRNFTFGFVVNTTNRFQESPMTSGTQTETSFTGSEAYWAGMDGYDFNSLLSSDAYENYSAPWRTIVAAQSGMISNLANSTSDYIGAAEYLDDENNIFVPGPLDQSYQRHTTGFKYDYAFNFGMNVSDFIYLGMNLGITSFDYDSATRYTETAQDPYDFKNDFTITGENGTEQATAYFKGMRYDYRYKASGAGVYAKFGVIVTPFSGLRLGAAIQTPTSTTITEHWMESGSTTFDDSRFNGSAESPEGEYSYRLISPFRANFGAAWTFGNFGLISLDYELCDYSSMRFKEMDDMQSGEFDIQNADIRDFMGTSHMLRAGIEIKPVPQFAIRAGYGLTTSPEKTVNADGNIVYINRIVKNTATHKGSFGFGYSSNGSFFADLACCFTKYGNEYITPYQDYIFDDEGNTITLTPEILNKRTLWNVMLTLGFRF